MIIHVNNGNICCKYKSLYNSLFLFYQIPQSLLLISDTLFIVSKIENGRSEKVFLGQLIGVL